MSMKPTKKIEVNDGKLTLTVQAVNQTFLRQLLLEMGDPEELVNGGLATLKLEAKVSAVKGADNYLNYCLAMGVQDKAPKFDEDDPLAFFMSDKAKKAMSNQNIARANWLRFFINDGEGLSMNDQSILVAEITALTFGTTMNPAAPAPKKTVTRKAKREYTE